MHCVEILVQIVLVGLCIVMFPAIGLQLHKAQSYVSYCKFVLFSKLLLIAHPKNHIAGLNRVQGSGPNKLYTSLGFYFSVRDQLEF